eukprot:jgi/Astpho2/4296/Aster-x1211
MQNDCAARASVVSAAEFEAKEHAAGRSNANDATAGKPRGVTRHRRTRRWEAHIWYLKKQVYLGGYDSRDQASRAHDIMALKTRGTGCQLNFDEAVYSKLMSLLPSVTADQVVEALRHQSKGQIAVLIDLEQPPGASRSGKRTREGLSDGKPIRSRSSATDHASRSGQPPQKRPSTHARTSTDSLLTSFQPAVPMAPHYLASYNQGLEQLQRQHQALQSPPAKSSDPLHLLAGALPAALPDPDSLDALSGMSAAASSVQNHSWRTPAQQQYAEWAVYAGGSLQGASQQQGASSCLSRSIAVPTSAVLFQDGALPVAAAFSFAAAGNGEGVAGGKSSTHLYCVEGTAAQSPAPSSSSSILSAAHSDMACELFNIPQLPPRAFATAPGLSVVSSGAKL